MLGLLLSACVSDQPAGPDTSILAAKGGGGGGPKVTAADPDVAEQGTTLDVRVIGSGFEDGSVVKLLIAGKSTPKILTNSTSFVDGNNLIANITIAVDAEIAAYDVEVTPPRGRPGVGSELFSVTAATQGQPVVQAVEPTIASPGKTLDVRVLGSGFDNGSQVTFLGGAGVTTNSTVYVGKSEVVANITIAVDAVIAFYDVEVVTGSGKRAVGVGMFNVSDGEVEHWSLSHDITYHERTCCSVVSDIVLLSSGGFVPPVRIDLTDNDFWLYLGSSWAPDGNTLIFCGDDGVYALRRVAPAAARAELLFTAGCGNTPRWSPNGSMIAYTRIPDTPPVEGCKPFELFVQSVDPSGAPLGPEVQISNEPGINKHLISWAPDSRRVAMLSTGSCSPGLGIIVYDVTDSSRQTIITPAELGGGASSVAWANRSDRLAVTRSGRILIVDFRDPGNVVTCNLTADLDVSARNPTWSPDDSKLLFQRKAAGRNTGFDLVTVDLSTEGPGCPAAYSDEVLVPVTGKKRAPVSGTYPQWRR